MGRKSVAKKPKNKDRTVEKVVEIKTTTHILKKTTTSNEKNPNVTFRSNFISLIKLFKSLKLRNEHMEKLRDTPFASLFDALFSKKIDSLKCRKSDDVVIKILKCYDDKSKSFLFGLKKMKLVDLDISSIFGINCGEKIVDLVDEEKEKTLSFVERRCKGERKLSGPMIQEILKEVIKGKKAEDVEDVARLIMLYAFINLFFSTTVNWISRFYIRLLEDFDKIKDYNWSNLIKVKLMSLVHRHHKEPVKITGCVIALSYWLCEKTHIIEAEEEEEETSPGFLKWDLTKLKEKLDKVSINSITIDSGGESTTDDEDDSDDDDDDDFEVNVHIIRKLKEQKKNARRRIKELERENLHLKNRVQELEGKISNVVNEGEQKKLSKKKTHLQSSLVKRVKERENVRKEKKYEEYETEKRVIDVDKVKISTPKKRKRFDLNKRHKIWNSLDESNQKRIRDVLFKVANGSPIWYGEELASCIYYDDISALIREAEISSSVIDAWGDVLMIKQAEDSITNGPDFTLISSNPEFKGSSLIFSTFVMKLINDGNNVGRKKYLDDRFVNNFTKNRFFIFPLYHGAHFTLAVLDAEKKEWKHYNPLHPTHGALEDDPHYQQAKTLRDYVSNLMLIAYGQEDADVNTLIEPVFDCPQQNSGSVDCGIMVCHMMRCYVEEKPVNNNFDKDTCSNLRKEMVEFFCNDENRS